MIKVNTIKTNKILVKEKAVETLPKYINSNDGEHKSSIKEIISNFNSLEDENKEEIEIIYKNKSSRIGFMSMNLPFCCGVIEIGDLKCSSNIELKDLQDFVEGLPTLCKGCTLIINTNGQQPSIMFEKVLPKCKNWVLIKTFKNQGRNTIKMWVSNND